MVAMSQVTIDDVLEQLRQQLNLSKESEWELIEEIRAHLEDAVDAAQLDGKDGQTALLKAAEDFGFEEVSHELQKLHGEWEMTQVLLLCIVPIVCTVVLRWLVFSAEGTTTGFKMIFDRPGVIAVGLTVLVLPILQLKRWPLVIFGWLFFWSISFVFMAFPSMRIW